MSDVILVTGASGLLGANFVLTAREQRENVVALCYPQLLSFLGVRAVRADLTDDGVARELLRDFRPGWIIHCAALTDVDWCESHRDETWRVNVTMTRNLAIVARNTGAGFVYISTDSVFDGKTGGYSEDSEPAPLNVYSESKLAGERAVREELRDHIIVRTNLYGWNAEEKMSLAEWVLNKLTIGQSVNGFHDVIFAPILVNDLSETILDMIGLGLRGTYHVAGSQECSKYEFALQLADVFGLDKQLIQPVSIASSTLSAPRPRSTWLKTHKVTQALNKPMPDVKSGLQHFKLLRDSGFVAQLKALRGG
jgi:dTDP-4-dehydrorhamnose reductase